MRPERLEALRFAGYSPRTLLDVGAHLGHFSEEFRRVFPACVPTLVEPNPYCLPVLAASGHEVLGIAASDAHGEAELLLTREWLQSTGSSLYRENTHFFRDEVLVRQPVPKRRLDDVLAGRAFDFVKIDTQGAELDVLRGGRAVLRRADYILIEVSLVEYNQGGARAEEVFAALAELGFRSAEVAQFHRLRGVQDGALLQLDFLFEREVARPSQALRDPAPGFPQWLASACARCPDFRLLSLGIENGPAGGGTASPPLLPSHPRVQRDWDRLLRHCARHGRFAFALADLGTFSLAEAALCLEMLPRVAEAGLVMKSVRPKWSWRDEDGVLQLRAGPGQEASLLQWRGAIAVETAAPARARKAA